MPSSHPVLSSVFITGTDTGIGKTTVSCALLAALAAHGARFAGMKPVASGCERTPEGLRNADAEALIALSQPRPAYAACNPLAFAAPIAPHLAAADAGTPITLEPLLQAYALLAGAADGVVVEGIGGWRVPLSDTLMQADLVRALGLPVILVVGLRLGCLNHALLSAAAIVADGCALAGWIGNRIDPAMERVEDNLATLRTRLPVPCFGVLPHGVDPRDRAATRQLETACAWFGSASDLPR
jgi:dethiobiotin synthetase